MSDKKEKETIEVCGGIKPEKLKPVVVRSKKAAQKPKKKQAKRG